jgi:hypothetical protein
MSEATTMATTTETALPPFLRIPQEIREKIYAEVFASHMPYFNTGSLSPCPRTGQLLRVNKLIYEEAAPILYRETTFEYSPTAFIANTWFLPGTAPTCFMPPEKFRKHIRHLSIPSLDDPTLGELDVNHVHFADNLIEYSGLRTLTITVGLVTYNCNQSYMKWTAARDGVETQNILELAKMMPKLEVALNGNRKEKSRIGWQFSRLRMVLKEGQKLTNEEKPQKRRLSHYVSDRLVEIGRRENPTVRRAEGA